MTFAQRVHARGVSPIRVLVIGASTGGPQALGVLLAGLTPHLGDVPVVIVLHMPASFTTVVSRHIGALTKRETRAAVDGEALRGGIIYLAPGETHLRLTRRDDGAIGLVLADSPPENMCKPAVDVLFRSAAETVGAALIGVVLTGMGQDGCAGARAIVEAGGLVIAQDRATSAVWGMPGAVVEAGLACAVLPLAEIAEAASRMLIGLRPRSAP